MPNCEYIKNSNQPCKDCPKVISALYMCGLLQEIQKESEEKTEKKSSMTKAQAIEAMNQGKKVTHDHFNSNEWMTIEDGQILLEDGVRCSLAEFWHHRSGLSWESGYALFTNT